jgi:hypothetical protein
MRDMTTAAYGGARELISGLPSAASVTFTTFSTSVHIGCRLTRGEALATLSAPVASGRTALYDALVEAIEAETDRDAGHITDQDSPVTDSDDPSVSTTTIVVITDGFDTSSTRTAADARRAVQAAQEQGMRILFLGANQDAVLSAAAIGVPADHALTYGANAPDMHTALRSLSAALDRTRSGEALAFRQVERQASARPPHARNVHMAVSIAAPTASAAPPLVRQRSNMLV